MADLGTLGLIVALPAYIFSWFAYRRVRPDDATSLPGARKALLVAGGSLLAASGVLMWMLLTRDYKITYVYTHVSNDLPILYVISAFWAGQEGSFLLWALFAAAVGYALTFRAGEWEAPVMRIYLPSALVLVVLTLIASPFVASGRVPADGAGLNPLLRDPWMAIHPPVTFLGYAALAAPFAYAIASLRGKRNREWITNALPWTLVGWLALGTGIIMGGFWAYKVLGWGGWWGWDPVENASLLPWLTGTALFHGLLLERTRNKFGKTNILLAVLTFGLVIYSTFLTRSGLLGEASVHSFGASGVGLWIGIWLVLVVGFGAYELIGARARLQSDRLEEPLFSREVLMVVGAIVLIMCTAVIGLGTSAPLLSRIAGGEGAAVDISFYGRTTLPLGILMALGIGLSVLMRWKGAGAVSRHIIWIAAVAGLFGMGAIYMMGVRGLLFLLFAGSGFFALTANVMVFERALVGQGIRTAGGYLAHIGVAFMLVAIVAATTGHKQKADLVYQTPTRVLGYVLTFTGLAPEPGGKQSTIVSLARVGETSSKILRPKLYRMYGSGQMMTRAEPHIHRSITGDLYIAPAQYLPPEQALAEQGELITLVKGESRELGGFTITFEDYEMGGHGQSEESRSEAVAGSTIGARIRVDREGSSQTMVPRMSFAGVAQPGVALPGEVGGELRLQSINADMGTVELLHSGGAVPIDGRSVGGILTVELSEKPLMSMLWVGVILVLLGGGLAIWRRMLQITTAVG